MQLSLQKNLDSHTTMTDCELTELDTHSTVYRLNSFDAVYPTHVPANAKSRYTEEHDVEYCDLYATTVESGTTHYVIVGEVE